MSIQEIYSALPVAFLSFAGILFSLLVCGNAAVKRRYYPLLVKAGIGISFVSKWSAFEAVREGSVRLLPLTGPKLQRRFYMISPRKESATFVADSFANFIREFRFFVPF